MLRSKLFRSGLVAALMLVIAMSLSARAGGSGNPIVGTWTWFNGKTVEFHADGSAEDKSGQFDGAWSGNGKEFSVRWMKKGRVYFTDSLKLSDDHNSLTGSNQSGAGVSASRKIPVTLSKAPPAKNVNRPENWHPNEWMEYIEQVGECIVDYGIGKAIPKSALSQVPFGEVYSVLEALPLVTKEALRRKLMVKMEECMFSDTQESLMKQDIYQAYYTALTTGDKSRLLEVKARYGKAVGE